MSFNFELILFYATVIAGFIALFDILFFSKRRKIREGNGIEIKKPILIEYARSFFPILLIVFLLRSFLYEPYRIPSGSLEPTLLMGDFILVNKFDYGIRAPILHQRWIGKGKPKRGDIMVFRWPPNPSVSFIKRVIGLPGDHINYIDKKLYINGQAIPQEFIQKSLAEDEGGKEWLAFENQENLLGVKHKIYIDPDKTAHNYKDIVVPPNMYFVMGDNRDDSADSRFWGFVPDHMIIGKAVLIWMSWNGEKTNIRWGRLGKKIH